MHRVGERDLTVTNRGTRDLTVTPRCDDGGMAKVLVERRDSILIVTINRPEVRNAVDRETAQALADAFRAFDADDSLDVAILTGAAGAFCAGADLKAVSTGNGNEVAETGDGPMGPTRMLLSKPVIAAVEGHAVAGGLELACWCDLRVAAANAIFGVYCRRFGVPLVDGGTYIATLSASGGLIARPADAATAEKLKAGGW